MNHDSGNGGKQIYKVVLTGGPCGGKTTGMARVTSFFQSLGWKVYRISEAAFTFLSGGMVFPELNEEAVYQFQKNLIYCMMQIEKTFDDLAAADTNQKILIICDRGVMDSTAYMLPSQWQRAKSEEGWSETEIRDRRYNQVVHMVSAAKGACDHYGIDGHVTRLEPPEMAERLDDAVANAWVGHPYYDVIDNSTGFEDKLLRMLHCICARVGIDADDRLATRSRKLKFLVSHVDWGHECLSNIKMNKFLVENRFLAGSINSSEHSRIRSRRGQDNDCTFVHTTRSVLQAAAAADSATDLLKSIPLPAPANAKNETEVAAPLAEPSAASVAEAAASLQKRRQDLLSSVMKGSFSQEPSSECSSTSTSIDFSIGNGRLVPDSPTNDAPPLGVAVAQTSPFG